MSKHECKPFEPRCYGIFLLLALSLGGCAGNPPPLGPQPLSEYYRAQIGHVQVVPSFESEEATSGVTVGKGTGAALGAGQASAGWLAASIETGNPITAAVGIALTPVAAVAGGVYGGVVADSAEDVARHVEVLDQVLSETSELYALQLQAELVQAPELPAGLLKDLALPPQRAADARLEIDFRELQGSGGGPKSELSFSLTTDTRLFIAGDPYPVYERSYTRTTPVKRLSAWVANDGEPLRSAIADITDKTVRTVLKDYFLASPYVTEPLFPAKSYVFQPVRLQSSRPEFRWRTLEGRHVVDLDENRSLRYELLVTSMTGKIWQAADIRDLQYAFAEEFPQCDTYAWQVRANYESMGQIRSSGWSAEKRFRTPCAQD